MLTYKLSIDVKYNLEVLKFIINNKFIKIRNFVMEWLVCSLKSFK